MIDFPNIVAIITIRIETIVMATITYWRSVMNIVIINGSPRENGATGQILKRINETIMELDANVKINYVDLSKMNLLYCDGCLSCYKTGVCHVKEDGVEELSQQIADSDAVVFGTPTYASNVSGEFKVLIDRGQYIFKQSLRNKACFTVVTNANRGAGGAKKVINELIRLSGGSVSCEYVIKLNPNSAALNDTRNAQITKLCIKFLKKVEKENPLSIFERIFRYIACHIGIKPYILKNKAQHKGIIEIWKKHGLISGDVK